MDATPAAANRRSIGMVCAGAGKNALPSVRGSPLPVDLVLSSRVLIGAIFLCTARNNVPGDHAIGRQFQDGVSRLYIVIPQGTSSISESRREPVNEKQGPAQNEQHQQRVRVCCREPLSSPSGP
jgi:hypothetical protein